MPSAPWVLLSNPALISHSSNGRPLFPIFGIYYKYIGQSNLLPSVSLAQILSHIPYTLLLAIDATVELLIGDDTVESPEDTVVAGRLELEVGALDDRLLGSIVD